MTSFRLAVLHLSRHRSSTTIAILCVAVAAFAAGTLVGILTAFADPLEDLDASYDAVVGPKSSGLAVLLGGLGAWEPSQDVIPYSLARFLERKNIARHMIPLYACGRYLDFNVFGTDDRFLDRPDDLGRPQIGEGSWFKDIGEAVVGATVLERGGLTIGDTISIEGFQISATQEETHWRRDLRIVGVFAKSGSPMDRAVLVSLETSKEAYLWAKERDLIRETKNDEAMTYLWVAANPGDYPVLEHWMHAASVGHFVNVREELAFLRKILKGAKAGGVALGGFVLLMAGIAIVVLANARFEALRPELGVLRALGYARSQIAGWMLWESLIISAAGLGLAILFEALGLRAIDFPFRLEWSAVPTPWPTLWSWAVWIAVLWTSIVAACLAVLRLYRTDAQESIQGY